MAPPTDPVTQMNTYRSYVTMLADPNAKDESKLKAAQEMSENFEVIILSPQYPTFLDHLMKNFLKILQEGEPHFISEYNIQQVRKLILEMIHRLPGNDYIKPYIKQILSLMLKLLTIENEENVIVCLRIIIELQKQFRPTFNPEIQQFLQFVKMIYSELPKNMPKIFEPRGPFRVSDFNEININLETWLNETFTVTPIQSEKKSLDGTVQTYNLIPKALLSLKVLQELPIMVVLMYQIYKQNVHQEISDFIPLIMTTITLQPSVQQRSAPGFNKEVFVDFIGAQIKTCSFLAFIIRIYADVVRPHSSIMVKGLLGLMTFCPPEVAHLRKELLVAARHILATDFKIHFVPYIDRLFNEEILLGSGWTTYESLRPLAYSTIADLVHHVRQSLTIYDLSKAVYVFSLNVHDQNLPTAIQTMSCKLLLNLVDCIRQRSDGEYGTQGRELLMKMLEVFVLKFKTIAKLQLPALMAKAKQLQASAIDLKPTSTEDMKDIKPSLAELQQQDEKETKTKFGFPSQQPIPNQHCNVVDCRGLVKTLVCGVKSITWGCANCKTGEMTPQLKQFQPKETLVFIRLVKWALQALDIYTIGPPALGALAQPGRPAQPQTVRSKEEKEVLEHFGGVFTMMNHQTFHEIFSTSIEYMVERIFKNTGLQIIANSFLANPTTSPIFATVLVEYLLERIEEMGSSVERSNLYLRLFKLVFGSVSLFPAENEHMLRPHLHQIVNKSMELAMSAKEPYNYFLLLRALFRSIGGGSHDLLYQEFLPLLPNLLEGLNRLQSGLHKQHMKDLFVELCLTVPVRLSSLLPYLPMLMDPLVSALNGSHTLVSQGLRTLELCVDNLQPDFLYEHIQPVRADLMQALWRTLRNPTEQVAHVAFRVLGKFGGGNRKMMIEPQKLEYNNRETNSPAVTAYFQEPMQGVDFFMEKIIDTALTALKSNTTDLFYRKQCWEVIYCYLAASIRLDDDRASLYKFFMHPSFKEGEIPVQKDHYKCPDRVARNVQKAALTGLFVASAQKNFRHIVLGPMFSIVRHYTMIAIAQQAGPFCATKTSTTSQSLDPLVLIDAIAVIMSHEDKDLFKPGNMALVLILETSASILGSKERACELPFMEYLAEQMCSLCYERAWYAKLGGCMAIKFLFERMATKWVLKHLFAFFRALMFVMMDLTGEVSNGAIDMAKANLEKLLRVCAGPGIQEGNAELMEVQSKALYNVTDELVKQVTSPHAIVREQSMASLRLLAEVQNKSVTEVMEPYKDILADIIPPKKHLLRHQPANAQIGLMDGNTFCTTLTPRLFTIDLKTLEHKVFFEELQTLNEAEDMNLNRLPCYKTISNLIPLRKSALRALAACHYIPEKRQKIFEVLYASLEKPNTELQETAFECMQKFVAGFQIEMESVHAIMRPMLLTLGDHRNLSLNCVKRLSYLTQLFPSTFSITLCEQLLQHLKKLLENLIQAHKGVSKTGENEQKIATIIEIFHQIPAATPKFIDVLCRLVLQAEKALLIEACSPFRIPLMKFLLRYPTETLTLFLNDNNIKDQQWSRYLEFLIKHKDGKPFRDVLCKSSSRLVAMLLIHSQVNSTLSNAEKDELQHQAIRIVRILIKFDEQWLSTQMQLVAAIRQVWSNEEYHIHHKKVEKVDLSHWKEPKLVVKILLHYFCHHPNDIDVLFQLLRAFCGRYIPDFQFLKDFLDNTVAQEYTVEWKRSAFFRFVELFSSTLSPELKAKIVQMIIIPCFAVSFEKGEDTKLVGSAPLPYQDSSDNVISVFINKIIDPENPLTSVDCVRIALLQCSCLLVELAPQYIHDSSTKRQGNKLRKLMTFAWPCLLTKNCVDPVTRYHGHLLLSHVIAKFAIHKKIVLQVFHSLLKAHAVEARSVVRQALEIITPAIPVRMEDGYKMLTHWTKKIIVEEGHSMQQLFHILQLVVRHYKVYYPVRHHLVQHMVNSIQRLGFNPSSSIEHRRLAVELAEVIIKWEFQRIKDEGDVDNLPEAKRAAIQSSSGGLIPSTAASPGGITKSEPGAGKPIERAHADNLLNFLMRLACQVNDASGATGNLGEQLSRRCVSLLKMALKPDMWPQSCDLKFGWLDKVFCSVETATPNFGNICTALELLTFLLGVMKKDQVLASFKPLQRGLSACIASSNAKVVRLTHALLSRLMTIFPTETSTSSVASKYEELDSLYTSIGKFIVDGLTAYEKNPAAQVSSLFGTLMMLKATCTNNQGYIDRMLPSFMRVLNRMAKDHLHPTQGENNQVASELLIAALDLVKNRVGIMNPEMRKSFITTILISLIEKTQDIKVMKAIVKMLEEWMKNKGSSTANQTPSLREKTALLTKLMNYVEKRFPDDLELNAQFLELVNFVYRNESLKSSELYSKLEPAFLSGLRCLQPHIRAKFFEVFDSSMRRKLSERLFYIICSQAWNEMGPHYWIKQCIELLLVTANPTTKVHLSNQDLLLPSVNSLMNMAEGEAHKNFLDYSLVKEEPMEGIELNEVSEDVVDLMDTTRNIKSEQVDPSISTEEIDPGKQTTLSQLIANQAEFLEQCKKIRTEQLLNASAQLCHMDTSLAEKVWLELFPQLWNVLEEAQQNVLIKEITSFVSSGIHVLQKDCHPSALATFLEALSHCSVTLPIKPAVMKYLGKSHNLWHRMTLSLEQQAFESGVLSNNDQPGNNKPKREVDCYDFEPDTSLHTEILDSLTDLYKLLCEEDMWCGLWQKHAYYKETMIAMALEQQGYFEKAQVYYDQAMVRCKQEFVSTPAPVKMQREMLLWEKRWIKCAKELNQWDILLEYGSKRMEKNHFLILESSWRIPNWTVMKDALATVEQNCPKEMMWKVNMYRGFLAICHSEDQHLSAVERYVELASNMCMREWRRLPHIVSHIHLPLLQAAQQIMELQEAMQIHQGLLHGRSSSIHDMKAIVKTWRNRLPVVADDLSHWSDIFTWRQHHYTFISTHYEHLQEQATNHSMLGVHASAQAIIHFGKIARKHNLTHVCLDSLSRIYTIPSVPIVDCFQKIRQQVKCYVQMTALGKNELQEGLDVIESTNLRYFTKEMTAEFYALKGMLLAHLGRSDEANKAFSAATQLHDTLVKAWALWGEYLENVFVRHPQNLIHGEEAIICFLHACRHQNEGKSRKYLAKVLWLLSYDNEKAKLLETLEKYTAGVPPLQWLSWIPQLLACLVRFEKTSVLNMLSQVGRAFPQAVYFSIRTLYLTLKIEQREKFNNRCSDFINNARDQEGYDKSSVVQKPMTQSQAQQQQQQQQQGVNTAQQVVANTAQRAVNAAQQSEFKAKATVPMWMCSKIMHLQREIHPTILSSLEGIVDQLVWFRETWYEEVLRQLRQGLAKCYTIAFENRGSVSEATITPHTLNFVNKLVSTFENISSSQNIIMNNFASAGNESLARRAQATFEDPDFQKMKSQFVSDFDFSVPGARLLHNLISKFKKWIKILDSKTKQLPRSFLIEEKCRFLSNYCLKTADVELFGEFLIPKLSHYYVKIARFMPRAEVIQRHNAAARRLRIRGHNGRIYPYLVVNDACLGDAKREERVLQVFRFLNHYLTKQKETSRRFLHFTVPRVVGVTPQMRLVEDNPASVSLLDIYKQSCAKLGFEHDAPIARYYEKLAVIQAKGHQASHQILREILKEVQTNMVPKTMLKDWAMKTYPSATDYWTFRKMFTLQLSLICFAEYALHLTRLNPDMMYIHQDSGLINVAYFRFDVDDTTGELDANRPVPFRITPNILEFITSTGICGPLTASAIATARCLVQPNYKICTILRAILRDDITLDRSKRQEDSNVPGGSSDLKGETAILMVSRAVDAIMTRLNTLATFDGNDSKVGTLVAAASHFDNLCRMDPSWHPWL